LRAAGLLRAAGILLPALTWQLIILLDVNTLAESNIDSIAPKSAGMAVTNIDEHRYVSNSAESPAKNSLFCQKTVPA